MTNFEDNSEEIKSALNDGARAGIIAGAMIVESHAKANSRVDSGDTRDEFTYTQPKQDGNDITSQVGNPLMNAMWEEFGTGEHAENGKGRKGGWWYFDKKQNKWIFTYGKSPNPALRNAFRSNKDNIKRAISGEFSR